MTQYQKGILVMDYLQNLGIDMTTVLVAICDENLEQSYQLIRQNPQISKEEFLQMMQIEEEAE